MKEARTDPFNVPQIIKIIIIKPQSNDKSFNYQNYYFDVIIPPKLDIQFDLDSHSVSKIERSRFFGPKEHICLNTFTLFHFNS